MSKVARQRKPRGQSGTSRPTEAEQLPGPRTRSISRHEIARYLKSAPRIDARRFRKEIDSSVDQVVK